MLDLGEVVYLDLQKTASTFLTKQLVKAARGEKIGYRQHGPYLSTGVRSIETICVSIRRPEDYYPSLFAYGCDNRGGVFKAFERARLKHVFEPTLDGFVLFLSHLASGRFQSQTPEIFPFGRSAEYGLFSQRFLKILGLKELPPERLSTREIRTFPQINYGAANPLWVLRVENLIDDVRLLIESHQKVFLPAESLRLASAPRVNASRAISFGLRQQMRMEVIARNLDPLLQDLHGGPIPETVV